MLKKIALGILAVIALFLIFVATRPGEFHIERSATIPASPSTVFSFVNDFRKWDEWSPWAKLDPAMKKDFKGPASGTGSIYEWSGNDKVGQGRQTITASVPNQRVQTRLEFLKPWAATNTSSFELKQAGDGTRVTWSMDGTNNFMAKAFCLFMDVDKLVGRDFEKGLATLANVAKAAEQANRAAVSPTRAP